MIDKEMNPACMRGGSLRPLTNYQSNPIMEPGSPHTAWQFSVTQHVKQEPVEEDKNDSGITSGSDFHSSSPGSDASQDLHHVPFQNQNPLTNRFYSNVMPFAPYAHNPLTPPNSEPLVSPKSEKEDKDGEAALSPCSSPSQDHLRRLEMSLEKSGLFSTKPGEHPAEDSFNKSDNDDFDEQSLRVPKVNVHGKVKTFKCKQCDFVTFDKEERYEHSKIHIKEEKRLTCPKCPFVTEYKHHLEYHLRNHAGSKPFHCNKCDYTCVNKSMLNSHMKSHSNIYRYSCSDCNYATKYCHSLKIHLRRYKHRPNVVLDEEGQPCPDVIIDVNGTRRGPKVKAQKLDEPGGKSEVLPFNLGLGLTQQLPFPAYPFFGGFPNAHLLQQLLRERQALSSSSPIAEEPTDVTVLDLSKPGCSHSGEVQKSSRRKGPAFKVDPMAVNSSDDDEEDSTGFGKVEREEAKKDREDDVQPDSNNNKGENSCQYCNIAFGDPVLYTIHMGYHGFHNPFTCNMCGVECADKVSFFLHVARVSHS